MADTLVTYEQYTGEIRKSSSLPPLSMEDMARARDLGKALIRSEDKLDDIVDFGSKAHAALAQISREMLSGVRVGTLDDAIRVSDNVMAELNSVKITELSATAGRFWFIFKETTAAIKHRVDRFFQRWTMVNTRLDRQEADIFTKETEATHRYNQNAALARTNFEILREAHIMLMAIKIFLDGEHGYAELHRREQKVAAEQETARRDNRAVDYMVVVAAERYSQYISRLEEKAGSLMRLLVSAYQTSVAIRLMGNNENIIRQKLFDIRNDLLPMWRTNIALAYQAYQQQTIAEFMEQCARAEEEIRYWTADQIEKAARATAVTMTRPFNMAAIKYFNDKLASSLEIMKVASAEAKKIRDEAEKANRDIIADLGNALADNAKDEE